MEPGRTWSFRPECLSDVCVVLQVSYWRERSLHQAEAQQEEQQVLLFSGNRTDGRLPGLKPYSLYTLNIRVVNGKGEGPPSPNHNFETPEGGEGPHSDSYCCWIDSLCLIHIPQEAGEGRTAHNNEWNGLNGMVVMETRCFLYWRPFHSFRSSHYYEPILPI